MKVVEEVFERYALIIRLELPGGVKIGTTAEHPFWVVGRGWVPAGALHGGNILIGRDGQEVPLVGIKQAGDYIPVYNFQVADYHTYFVGCNKWGFSLWSHNIQCFHYTSIDGVKGMNASRSIVTSVTGYTGHGVTGAVVWVTPLNPAAVASRGGAKAALGLTREKAALAIELDLPVEALHKI